ncbi:uncharacterized protein BKA55DRAFT_336863 [Fusarium redolens]|uniref:CFEM domain-containing protein n=1 Tax=Fusarium redolens TaxID=48865 RepID=A0A9P9HG10_FUSRE|nr:uncharacterized protein BKA55DRAFT_336863 [Fusarium redolens]KAH7255937.1 hypothetical protein BKA55DRAFT_336863 [Fusarium redolens]
MRFSFSTLLALGALQTLGVYAQDCVNACVESVKPTVGCADATQAGCICVNPSFVKGVAECARAPSCNAADADITSFLSNGFCVGQQLPALPEAAATSASGVTTTSAAAATSSEVAAATSETPAAADTSEAASTSAVPPVTSEAPKATSTDAVDATSTAETAGAVEPTATESEASASATDADSSSTASEAAGAAATSDSSDDGSDKEESSGGMSGAAKAGVGIGVTIGILALLGIAGFFFWKKRQNQHDLPRGNMASMSPPMATRDRSYPLPDQGSIGEKNGYDMELMSHRYEDMLPREEPRHMV